MKHTLFSKLQKDSVILLLALVFLNIHALFFAGCAGAAEKKASGKTLTAASSSENPDVIMGEGTVNAGSYLNINGIRIPWSKANKYYGYLYKTKGVTFANVVVGPKEWNLTCYYTYKGFQAITDIRPDFHMKFSTPDQVVFTNEDTQVPGTTHKGILVFNCNGIYGAIDFIKIQDNTLYYRYWLNTAGKCEFTEPGGNKDENTVFSDGGIYEFDATQEFNSLEIKGDATVILDTDVSVNGTLTLSDGTLILKGNSADLNTVIIGEKGRLEIAADTEVHIKGNFTNHGEFIANWSNVVFDGIYPQVISGFTLFYGLTIESQNYVVATEAVDVQELSVYNGYFIPADESRFGNIFIDVTGTLFPQMKAAIGIQGDMDIEGRFYHDKSTLTFNGETDQVIITNGAAFYNVTIEGKNGTTVRMDVKNILNDLFIDDDSELIITETDPSGE